MHGRWLAQAAVTDNAFVLSWPGEALHASCALVAEAKPPLLVDAPMGMGHNFWHRGGPKALSVPLA
jgi:hypothetical protein